MNIENRELSQKLVDTIDFLKQSISKISVYDLNYYSMTELYYGIANKINELIETYHEFGVSISEEVIKQNECLQYLLNDGLIKEVVNKINQMVADGTMDTIINHNIFNDLNSQIKDIENNNIFIDAQFYGAKGDDLTDNTSIFQKIIDDKNYLFISKPGIYRTKTLIVKSNTTIHICEGVTLKLQYQTRNYLITNNSEYIENFSIIGGGKLNFAFGADNHKTGAYKDGEFPGHGIFLNHCKNIRYENITMTGAQKYSSLIVDCENFIGENIYFDDTESDGLHFQPPFKNGYINNIKGKTGDDFVALTLGDYPDYEVSNVGDFENISISNLYGNECMCLVKITGSGLDSAYKFKNIKVDGLYGTTTHGSVRIMDDTSALVNTYPENVVIKNNFTTKTTTGYSDIELKCAGGNVVIDNMTPSTSSLVTIRISNNLDNLIIKNLVGSLNASTFLQLESNANVENLKFENVNLKNFSSKFIRNSGSLSNIIFESFSFKGVNNNSGTFLKNEKNNNKTIFCKINNSVFDTFFSFIETNQSLTLIFNNSDFNNISKRLFLDSLLTENDTVYLKIRNSEGEFNPSINSLSKAKFRLSMDRDSGIFKTSKSIVTGAVKGDIIRQDYEGDGVSGLSIWINNGTNWSKLFPLE